jgi:hypothetical protein
MSLFREVGMHAGLGRTIAHIGTERFWKQLLLCCTNACRSITHWLSSTLDGAPQAWKNTTPSPAASRRQCCVPQWVVFARPVFPGLPRRLCQRRVPPGEITDHFRQSEYFLGYFHDNVLEDEVQFILQLPGAERYRCHWACSGGSAWMRPG